MIGEDVTNNITTSLLITGYTKTAFLTSKRFDEHPPELVRGNGPTLLKAENIINHKSMAIYNTNLH